jgi:hypothetical protein
MTGSAARIVDRLSNLSECLRRAAIPAASRLQLRRRSPFAIDIASACPLPSRNETGGGPTTFRPPILVHCTRTAAMRNRRHFHARKRNRHTFTRVAFTQFSVAGVSTDGPARPGTFGEATARNQWRSACNYADGVSRRHDSRRLACWFHRRADARCRQRYGACTVDHAVKALRPAFPCVDWGRHARASMILEKHPAGGPWMLFRGGRFPRVGQMRSLLGTASHFVRFGWGPKQA